MTSSIKRKFVTLTIVAILVISFATTITAFAEETISEVSISVSYGEVDSGGVFYSPQVTSNSSSYYVDDYEFEHSDSGSAKTGTLEVTLRPSSGYVFAKSGWSKSKIDIDGDANYSKVVSSSSSKLVIRLKYDLDGELSSPEEVEWQGFWATWEEVDGASYYEVKFRGSTYTVYDTEYNLSSYVRLEKENTFKVRARNSSMKSEWVESDSIYPESYSENDYWGGNGSYNGCYPDYGNDSYYRPGYGPNGYNGSNSGPSGSSSSSYKSGWEISNGTWYYYSSGSMVKNTWIKDGSYWYYLNADGSMAVGWKYLSGKWYFLSGNSPTGHMLADSEVEIGGVYYRFNSDGSLQVDTYVRGRYIDVNGYVH